MMEKLSRLLSRKDFLNEELRRQADVDDKKYIIKNIISREYFVKDDDLKNKYGEPQNGMALIENLQDVKLLDEDEKVKMFDEYKDDTQKNKCPSL